MHDQTSFEELIRIQVQFVNGELLDLQGNTLSSLKEGTLGELIVPRDAVAKPVSFVSPPVHLGIPLFPQGHELYALMQFHKIAPHLIAQSIQVEAGPATGRLVKIELKEPLILEFGSSKKPLLRRGTCYIPYLGREAISLNHAYTIISEQFEPQRKSHTGNTFIKVFFSHQDKWVPLDDLRKRHEANLEHQLHMTAKK